MDLLLILKDLQEINVVAVIAIDDVSIGVFNYHEDKNKTHSKGFKVLINQPEAKRIDCKLAVGKVVLVNDNCRQHLENKNEVVN